ncbi:MAG: hypothetical protein IJJ10_06635 [Bacillus sp. (in: Bacteria)]|nr:hypothetical protein [Bacillus sp. (in: firmicutes)]
MSKKYQILVTWLDETKTKIIVDEWLLLETLPKLVTPEIKCIYVGEWYGNEVFR